MKPTPSIPGPFTTTTDPGPAVPIPAAPKQALTSAELTVLCAQDGYGLPDELRAAAIAIRQGCQGLPGGAEVHRFSLRRVGQDTWLVMCGPCAEGVQFSALTQKQRKKALERGEEVTTGLLQQHLQDPAHLKKAIGPTAPEDHLRVLEGGRFGAKHPRYELPRPQ